MIAAFVQIWSRSGGRMLGSIMPMAMACAIVMLVPQGAAALASQQSERVESGVVRAPGAFAPSSSGVQGWPAGVPTPSTLAIGAPCADVLFIGVPGSGEFGGYGPKVQAVRDGVREGYGIHPGVGDARNVREVYIDYPAEPTTVLADDIGRVFQPSSVYTPENWNFEYIDSINSGIFKLSDVLEDSLNRCPDEKWVIVGYSQGAMVINRVIPLFPHYERYGGVSLVANPHNSNDPHIKQTGTASYESWGIGNVVGKTIVPSEFNGLVFSECAYYDIVCDISTVWNGVVADLSSADASRVEGLRIHTEGYPDVDLKLSARPIVDQLLGMPVPTTNPLTIGSEPDEYFSGTLFAKPTRSDVPVTFHVLDDSQIASLGSGYGFLLATNGSYVGNLPTGQFTLSVELRGEFPDHYRTVDLVLSTASPIVNFSDPALEACVASAIGGEGDIRRVDMLTLGNLSCDNQNVMSLDGLEYATNLNYLSLKQHALQSLDSLQSLPLVSLDLSQDYGLRSVGSLEPLRGMTSLTSLNLRQSPPGELGALSTLVNLEYLNLDHADKTSTELFAISGLIRLKELHLNFNSMASLDFLAENYALETLFASFNQVTSLKQLSSLSNLRTLFLDMNKIASLDSFADLPNLEFLSVANNQLTSISSLANMDSLTRLSAGDNDISEISVIETLPNLAFLSMASNEISDISPLEGMSQLRSVWLSNNKITDFRALGGLTNLSEGFFGLQRSQTVSAIAGVPVALPEIWRPDGQQVLPSVDESGTAGQISDGFVTWVAEGIGYLDWKFEHESPVGAAIEFAGTIGQQIDQAAVGPSWPQVPTSPEVERLAGADRFATSAEVAKEYAPFAEGEGVVYIANGLNYPDALSAAPAAAFRGAPLLLTQRDVLPLSVREQIERLSPELIVIAGGTGVVSAAVQAELEMLAPTVQRHAGADRYATSRVLTQEAFGESGALTVFLATGTGFPDALAASAAAGRFAAPVVLVNGSQSTVPLATQQLLTSLGADQLFIAGGAGVVSEGIRTSLITSGYAVTRLAGADRYATSAAINEFSFDASSTVYLAVGTGYADALAGAALAGNVSAPLFVVPGNCVPQNVLTQIADLGATDVRLLGGVGALSTQVATLTGC